MALVKIPQNIAEIIEKEWDKWENTIGMKKHLVLNNWNLLINQLSSVDYNTLMAYASSNPINYMKALTEGYDLAFDITKSFTINTAVEEVTLSFTNENLEGLIIEPEKLLVGINDQNGYVAYASMTAEHAQEIINGLTILVNELKKL